MKKLIFFGAVFFILQSCLITDLLAIKPNEVAIKTRNVVSVSCIDGRTKFGEDIAELLNRVEVTRERTGVAEDNRIINTVKLTFYQKNGDVGSITLTDGLYSEKNDTMLWYYDGFVKWDGKLIWLKNGKLVKLENNVWSWVDQTEEKSSAKPFYESASSSKLDEEKGNILDLEGSDQSTGNIRIEASIPLW